MAETIPNEQYLLLTGATAAATVLEEYANKIAEAEGVAPQRCMYTAIMLDRAAELRKIDKPAQPVGEITRYGENSAGVPWHGIQAPSFLDLPAGTKLYLAGDPALARAFELLREALSDAGDRVCLRFGTEGRIRNFLQQMGQPEGD